MPSRKPRVIPDGWLGLIVVFSGFALAIMLIQAGQFLPGAIAGLVAGVGAVVGAAWQALRNIYRTGLRGFLRMRVYFELSYLATVIIVVGTLTGIACSVLVMRQGVIGGARWWYPVMRGAFSAVAVALGIFSVLASVAIVFAICKRRFPRTTRVDAVLCLYAFLWGFLGWCPVALYWPPAQVWPGAIAIVTSAVMGSVVSVAIASLLVLRHEEREALTKHLECLKSGRAPESK